MHVIKNQNFRILKLFLKNIKCYREMLNIKNKKKKVKRKENYKFIKKNYCLQLYIVNNKYINIIIHNIIIHCNIYNKYITNVHYNSLFYILILF